MSILPKIRKEAFKIKSVSYFTGKECKNGHIPLLKLENLQKSNKYDI